jgi:hypothetical protein
MLCQSMLIKPSLDLTSRRPKHSDDHVRGRGCQRDETELPVRRGDIADDMRRCCQRECDVVGELSLSGRREAGRSMEVLAMVLGIAGGTAPAGWVLVVRGAGRAWCWVPRPAYGRCTWATSSCRQRARILLVRPRMRMDSSGVGMDWI